MAERRVPPQNVDAEASVLAGVLLRADALNQVERLGPEDFYDPRHGHVFRAMRELEAKTRPIDMITLEEQLRVMDKLQAVGGVSFLADLTTRVATAANIGHYADIVKEKATARRLIEAASEIAEKGFGEIGEVKEYLDESEQKIFAITEQRSGSSVQPIKKLLKAVFKQLDKRLEHRGDVTGVPSGFTELDALTAGLQPSDLIILAARPAMGKCVREGTQVTLQGGRVVAVEDLVRAGSAADRVMTLGAARTFAPATVSAWVSDGLKPCFRVRTALGREVETTITHPFLTPSGWRKLGELAAGERIAVARRLDSFGDDDMSQARVRALACALAGGDRREVAESLRKLGEESADPGARARVARVVGALAGRRQTLGVAASARLARVGLRAASSGSLAAVAEAPHEHPSEAEPQVEAAPEPAAPEPGLVPGEVFTLRRARLAEYLRIVLGRGLLSAEGVRWIAPSERAARQIAHLLLRFGVMAKVRASRVHGGSHSLEIEDAPSLMALARELAPEGQEAKVLRFARAWDKRAEAGGQPEGDVMWDRIAAIEATGDHPVYDLTVPEGANFVANDVCVHNTSLALTIAQNAAIASGFPAIVFSLEMSSLQLVERMLCSEARIDSTLLRRGNLQRQDLSNLTVAASSIAKAPIFIDDTPGPTVHELRSRARRWRADRESFAGKDGKEPKEFGLIVIDYLQLMRGSQQGNKNSNREQEISEISRGLKALAKELSCPIVALSQLNRGVEQRQDKRPMISDLRECVTGDTLVLLADGRRVPIADLVGTTPRVLAMAPEGQIVSADSDKVWAVGHRPVFDVRLASGRRIRATGRHRLYAGSGWKRVDACSR